MKNIVIVWKISDLPALKNILTQLLKSHALNVLDGQVQVIPIASQRITQGRWSPPLQHERISYIRPKHIEDLWPTAAVMIVDASLTKSERKIWSITPQKVPTIWLGESCPKSGLTVSSESDLIAFCNKLLCDERMRTNVAPKILFPISQLRWIPSPGKRIIVLHVISTDNFEKKIESLLRIYSDTEPLASHSVVCLEDLTSAQSATLKASTGNFIEVPLNKNIDWFQLLRLLLPDILHLHDVSCTPRWLPIHRYLAEWNIIETEYENGNSAGSFGAIDVVTRKSINIKQKVNPRMSSWRRADSKYETDDSGGATKSTARAKHRSNTTNYYSDLYQRVLRLER